MAGSYNHIITDHGNLVSNERFANMIDNLGDAYEMTEEMYGMIWWLATLSPRQFDDYASGPDMVEAARQNYQEGLKKAKEANRDRRQS